jgi:hypothetical protein
MNAPYPSQPGQPMPGATIAVTAKFFPMAFFFFFVKPAITVDGYPVPGVWGRNAIPVAPGRHQVHVHTPYFLPSRVGPADTTVDVAPGQTLEVEYRCPVVVFMNGAIGAPPQKYPGMPVLIALYVVLALFIVCACVVPLIASMGGNQ